MKVPNIIRLSQNALKIHSLPNLRKEEKSERYVNEIRENKYKAYAIYTYKVDN